MQYHAEAPFLVYECPIAIITKLTYRNESPIAIITTLTSISVLGSGMQYDEVGAINEVETKQNPIAYSFSKSLCRTFLYQKTTCIITSPCT